MFVFLVVPALVAGAALAYDAAYAMSSMPAAGPAFRGIGPFQIAIASGADKGLSLDGRLNLRAATSGHLTWLLTSPRGAAVPLSGQICGLYETHMHVQTPRPGCRADPWTSRNLQIVLSRQSCHAVMSLAPLWGR
jgi:hypothetical protein